MFPNSEAKKLEAASARLRELLSSSGNKRSESRRVDLGTDAAEPADKRPVLSVNPTDFVDHTEKYRGKVVTLPLMVRSTSIIGPGRSIRDLAGGSARFLGQTDDGNRLDMLIELPAGLDIPK